MYNYSIILNSTNKCNAWHLLVEFRFYWTVSDHNLVEVSSSETAISLAREKRPHVVIMDLRMSVIGNLETSKQLLEENPEIKIIALAACLEKTIPEKLLQAGFYGYLSKNTTTKELVLVIKSVYAGKRYFTSWIAQNLARKVVHGYLPSTEKLPVQ